MEAAHITDGNMDRFPDLFWSDWLQPLPSHFSSGIFEPSPASVLLRNGHSKTNFIVSVKPSKRVLYCLISDAISSFITPRFSGVRS
jgi:hypothetical protein